MTSKSKMRNQKIFQSQRVLLMIFRIQQILKQSIYLFTYLSIFQSIFLSKNKEDFFLAVKGQIILKKYGSHQCYHSLNILERWIAR